jgi:hypothetical protein
MKERDVWLVGLLALTYLYLDAAAPRGRIRVQAPAGSSLPPEEPTALPSLPDFARDACPRDAAHSVSLRPDGAMWCLACDEGFFPVEMVM